jgi:hypothetical protein
LTTNPVGSSVKFVSDGYTTLNGRRGEAYIFATDAQGLPLEWSVWQEYEPNLSYVLGTSSCSLGCGVFDAEDSVKIVEPRTLNGIVYIALNEGTPGTWRLVIVPEPTTLLLVGVGIVGLIAKRVRQPQR